MQRTKRLISFLLTITMVLTLAVNTAAASFSATDLYQDVSSEDWFYENVKSLKEMNLMIGYHDGTFRPASNISMAESITVAARLHAAENQAGSFKQSDVWYEVYADYALENELLDKLPAEMGVAATRMEFAHLLAKALPLDNFVALNRVPEGAIPDVTDDEAIYLLYRAGVLIGADEEGNFYPERPITRGETAAIITRMADPSLRLKSGIFGIADVEVDASGAVKNETAINADGANATVAAGTAAEEGTTELALSVTKMEATGSNLQVEEPRILSSYDVHIDGLAADNSVPVIVELDTLVQKGLNLGNLSIYHVENGETVAMTQVASLDELDAHNEFYYDPATGKLTVAMATFSELAVVADAKAAWEGNSNADWYSDPSATSFTIANADQLAGLRDLVDAGNTFEGKTIVLVNDINLGGIKSFDPIGYGYDYDGYTPNGKTFNGTFDGNHKTISNLYQNGWELGYSYSMAGGGLFASVVDATFKNVHITGANVVMECIDMGILVGYSQGNCTYDHIRINNSKIANYQRATGGVIGEVSPKRESNGTAIESTHTLKDIIIGSDVVVGSLWGDFDAPCGGVIGARWDDSNRTYVRMTDVNVACQMDVYNDITSSYRWHAYRRAGMLIGNTDTPVADGRNAKTATADFMTCTNVTVGYGSWSNYHYCQFVNEFNGNANNWPWVRAEAGKNCAAYSNPRYGHPKDADGNPVVNDGHTHRDGEGHQISLPFAQLYGGGQGVYGAVSHPGVICKNAVYTVTYMNGTEVDEIFYVTDNSSAYKLKDAGENMQWLNSNGTALKEINAGNTKSVTVYKDNVQKLIAYFLDKDGMELYSEEFSKGQAALSANAPAEPPQIEGYIGKWESYDLAAATGSIFIKPLYTVSENTQIATAEQLFKMLEEGSSVVMSGDLTHAGSNLTGNKINLCEMKGDGKHLTARLNLNSCNLTCNFDHKANKSWHIFDLVNSTLTIAGGVNSEGTLFMDVKDVKDSIYVFSLDANSTLILEKGIIIEVKYPAENTGKIFAFKIGDKVFTPDTANYPGLYVDKSTDGVLRIIVSETTTIHG